MTLVWILGVLTTELLILRKPCSVRLGLSSPSRFDHLVHYGGSYYCYLFNRVISLATAESLDL